MRLQVKLTPHSARSGIAGWMGEALKVRVAAAAERGRANEALREVLAEALGVPKARVRIVAGWAASRKVVEVQGLGDAEAHRRLAGDSLTGPQGVR